MTGPGPAGLARVQRARLAGLLGVAVDGAVPAWMLDELVATTAARNRLRAWVAAGSIARTVDDIARRLMVIGDDEIAWIARNALLDRIPPPVVDFVLREVVVFGVGWSADGWSTRCAMPPGQVLNSILISGASRNAGEVLDVAKHEIAHAWLIESPADPVAVEEVLNRVDAGKLDAARDASEMETLLRRHDQFERQADALARTWGGHTDCAARDREHTIAAAHRLAERHGK